MSTSILRINSDIQGALRGGITQVIVHGENVYEDYFSETLIGAHDIATTLIYYLLYNISEEEREQIENVLFFSDDGLFLCRRKPLAPGELPFSYDALDHEKIRQMLGVQEKSSSSFSREGRHGNDSPRENSESDNSGNAAEYAEAARQEINNAAAPSVDLFRQVTAILEYQNDTWGVVVKDIEWLAELFHGRQHNFEYLKEIQKWRNLSNHTPHISFILMKSMDVFSNYFFLSEQSPGVIFAGGPTREEITTWLMRRKIEQYISQEEYIEKIASELKNRGFTLKRTVHLVKSIEAQIGADINNAEKFFHAVDERLEKKIEMVHWGDVCINEDTKTYVQGLFMAYLEDDETRYNEKPRGMILYGPPGTGKTLIAKALAGMGGFYFMAPKLADIKGEYVGHSSRNVQRIFNEARNNSPTLMFLDELDTLFPSRGGASIDSFTVDITNQFLAEIDGVDTGKQRVFIVGATNRLEILDPAIKSRLKAMYVPLPDDKNRAEMLRLYMKERWPHLSKEDAIELVRRTRGLSGRDIKDLCYDIHVKWEHSGGNTSDAPRRVMDAALGDFRAKMAHSFNDKSFSIDLFSEDKRQPVSQVIIGCQHQIARVEGVINVLRHKSWFKQYGLEDYNGILLYGPPGNGKTEFARACASAYGFDFVKVVGTSLATSIRDGTIKILDTIVDNCVKLSAIHPILLFFDEFDAIATGHSMDVKFRGALLDKIIELRKYGNILFVAATNARHNLDDAVIRDGRFDVHLLFDSPADNQRHRYYYSFCNNGMFSCAESLCKKVALDGYHYTEQQVPVRDVDGSVRIEVARIPASISTIKKRCSRAMRNALAANRGTE
ncbi:MAG: AAA family ATPase, partial [Spirochaetota bacterium]